MQLRFRAPVPLGERLVVTGVVKWKRRNVLAVEAAVRNAAGDVLASADGSFVAMAPLGKERLGVPDTRTG